MNQNAIKPKSKGLQIIWIIIAIIFLAIYAVSNRYEPVTADRSYVIDNWTGKFYSLQGPQYKEIHPVK